MECRLIRLGNGDVECERCKKSFGNFKDRPIPAGIGKKCNHHSVVKTFKRFAKSTARHVANGAARATATVYKKRLQICRDCEFYNNVNEAENAEKATAEKLRKRGYGVWSN